jgi:hypothetical protein
LEGQSEVEVPCFLFLQFCGVTKLAIIHHKIQILVEALVHRQIWPPPGTCCGKYGEPSCYLFSLSTYLPTGPIFYKIGYEGEILNQLGRGSPNLESLALTDVRTI